MATSTPVDPQRQIHMLAKHLVLGPYAYLAVKRGRIVVVSNPPTFLPGAR